MLQLIALILVSWGLLKFIEKENISVLGLQPNKQRMYYFTVLFIGSAVFAATTFLLRMYIAKDVYTLNQQLTFVSVATSVWHQIRTVLTEELLCRGALLYILIKRIGAKRAIFSTAIFFAALHWFNSGVWGNLIQMIIVFTFTFAMGLLLAYSYVKSYSLLLPFAIHLGWNLTQNYIFGETPGGNHIFLLGENPPTVTVSYLSLITLLLFPKIGVIVFNYFVVKKYQQAQINHLYIP